MTFEEQVEVLIKGWQGDRIDIGLAYFPALSDECQIHSFWSIQMWWNVSTYVEVSWQLSIYLPLQKKSPHINA